MNIDDYDVTVVNKNILVLTSKTDDFTLIETINDIPLLITMPLFWPMSYNYYVKPINTLSFSIRSDVDILSPIVITLTIKTIIKFIIYGIFYKDVYKTITLHHDEMSNATAMNINVTNGNWYIKDLLLS